MKKNFETLTQDDLKKVKQEEEANERLSKVKIKNWTIGHKKRILKISENLSKISKDSEKALMQSMWR